MVRQAHGFIGPLFVRRSLLLNLWYGSRNNHRGYHPSIVLYDLLSYQDSTRLPLKLYPLEIPPTNLLKISWAIRTSNHMAELVKKYCGTAHGATEMMKDQVLMNPAVAQLKHTSLQSGLESLHIQQDRV